MRTVLELQSEKDHELRCAQELVEKVKQAGRICTEEEQQEIDKRLKCAKGFDTEIAQVQEHEKRILQVEEAMKLAVVPSNRITSPAPIADVTAVAKPRIEVPSWSRRYGKLKAFKNEADAFKVGAWFRASFMENDFRCQSWCREHGVGYRNTLGGDTLGGGSTLVPEELSQSIIDLRELYGVFRQYCPPMPMGSDTMAIPRWASQLTASFVAENPAAANATSDPSFDNARLVAKKLWCSTLMSTEIAEDAIIDLADKLAMKFAEAFAHREDQCGFTGDGTSTYGGIQGVATWFNNNTSFAGAFAAAGGHHAITAIDNTDLGGCMASLPQYAHRDAAWYCSQAMADGCFQRLAAVAGGNTVQSLSGKFEPAYLGYPIRVSQVLPASLSTSYAGQAMALFGRLDLAAAFGERRGFKVSLTDQRYWELDQIGVKATERIDIVVHDVGNSTTAGPIVALMGTT